jgi:protein ImuB
MWQDSPRDMNVTSTGRPKLFMPTRGICQTPGIRANGPSYMKSLPSVSRPDPVQKADDPPMAIVRTIATRQEIVAVSASAMSFGIRPGLTLTEGRALCGELIAFDHDPLRDARSLEALARWMMRFTPRVALPLPLWERTGVRGEKVQTPKSKLSPSESARFTPHPNPLPQGERGPDQDCIYLDLTGCERALGSIEAIVHNVLTSLSRLRLSPSVAVAPTPGAAWSLASFGKNGTIVPRENLAEELSPLPVGALRLDDEVRESLHHLGIETIDQLRKIPRAALPARFGNTLLMRLDQALGRIDEPLVPLAWHEPIEARVDFDGLVDSLEAIWLTFKRLIGEVVPELTRRGCGARKIELEFFRAYAQKLSHSIALSRPSRDPVNLFNLIRCATENLADESGEGFLGIRLSVPAFERIRDDQIALLEQERYAGEIELARLIERLCIRLGESALVQPELVESHVPERAWRQIKGSCPLYLKGTRPFIRPLRLSEPDEIGVMVSPSDDRNGRPILFRHRSEVHELTHVVGPERISGEWWRGHFKTRDYFDVEDQSGRRFWIFRVHETGKWFVQGMF